MTQSPELTHFYRDILAWVEEGCPDHETFVRCAGLCYNLFTLFGYDLAREMDAQFKLAGLNPWYPFNHGSDSNYWSEKLSNTIYANPKRLAWIREHAS